MTTYMFVALIIASASCKEPRLMVRQMASPELCHAAANLATKAGGQADCVPVTLPHAGPRPVVAHVRQARRSNSPDGSEAEVQQLNRAQLNDR